MKLSSNPYLRVTALQKGALTFNKAVNRRLREYVGTETICCAAWDKFFPFPAFSFYIK